MAKSGASRVEHAPAPRRVLLVAGEASGDMHGADLLRALQARVSAVDVYGIGGDALRRAGMRTVVDSGQVATVGLVEGLGHLRALVRAYRALARSIRETPPDLCILIDFPEFNLRLARVAKRAGVPVLYYIGPQVWAWRRGRVRTIARRVDRLAVVFPFEPDLYAGRCRVEFVGHPLLDRVRATRSAAETRARHGLSPDRQVVLLLPGSRRKEIAFMLPAMLEAAAVIGRARPRHFVLGLAPTIDRAEIERLVAAHAVEVRVIADDTYNLMATADVALVTSGTATLECALLECPMVVAYRMAGLTYGVGRLLVRGVRHIAMPNIVAGREIVPELIQAAATPAAMAAAALAVLEAPGRRAAMVADLREVRARLGRGGAAARAAEIAVEMMAGVER
jgi:lipid-A-disaccharide synthase